MLIPRQEHQSRKEILDLFDDLDRSTLRSGPHHALTLTAVNKLAMALARAGDFEQAEDLLIQALESSSSTAEHSLRIQLLGSLGDVMTEQGRCEEAAAIYRERLELSICRAGETDPNSIAAKSDLACVLFDAGADAEANNLEEQARDAARLHLSPSHSVSSVLAWNRALRYENSGERDLATTIIADELSWLLTCSEATLSQDQLHIRAALANRLGWNCATTC